MKGKDYLDIPKNPFELSAGSILEATDQAITAGGASSRDFIVQQGGDPDTFILLLGLRLEAALLPIIEGVFLRTKGPGFHPTWGYFQLLSEVQAGAWVVIPRARVLTERRRQVETRMNRSPAR